VSEIRTYLPRARRLPTSQADAKGLVGACEPPTALERALKKLGDRVTKDKNGWRLDGRPASTRDVMLAGGETWGPQR
jgi:hypothetical protein